MQEFHKKTNITLKNSFEQTQFIDWRTQPQVYKTYPNFFRRFFLDNYAELKFIKNFGKITYTKTYKKDEVNLRVNPSAGGLYPCEIYIQIRAVKGFLSGIYHYEALKDSLVLIHELSNDSLEYYFEKPSSQKFIFLISNVYFRSSWKYEKRASRYLLLDTGHQLASIYTALKLENLNYEFCFDFNKEELNKVFGFESSEFFQLAIFVDNKKEIKSKKLREKLVSVSPVDYIIKNTFIEEFSKKINNEKFQDISSLNFLEELSKEELQNTVNKRRSIRAFKQEAIFKEEFDFILKDIFEVATTLNIEIFFINYNIVGLIKGIYKNVSLLKSGEYMLEGEKLAFNQKLGGSGAFTLFFTSKIKSNYVQTYILSGFLAHIINLRAAYLNIGCSGLGAYFDDICQDFLKTQNNILYLQAVGR